MKPSNPLSDILFEFSVWHEMQGDDFKPRAYQLASESVAALGDEIKETWKKGGVPALKKLPGIGQSIAEKIDEFYRTKRIKEYDALKKKLPVKISELARIEGLGAKHILDLYKKLKIKSVADLKRAVQRKKIRTLAGWGEKSEEKLARQIGLFEKESGRMLLGDVLRPAEDLLRAIGNIPGVQRCSLAGSIRRRQETVGDIDVIATGKNGKKILEAFTALPQVASVHESGGTKASVRLQIGVDADLRVVPDEVYGAALQYFTGDRRHNVLLRQYALSKGYTLSEYGLFKRRSASSSAEKKRGALVACKTEEVIYKKLGMDTPPPEIRIGEDELDAAKKRKLPKLISYGSVKGDLQVQTDWSDGSASIAEMAKSAKAVGLSYLAVTDHTQSLKIANGLDEKRLARQGKEIDRLNKTLRGFTVLKGTECDILKDGTLDLTEAARKKLDWVGIAVHSHFGLSRAEQTKRILKAISQPHVHCLFHPTGRLIGKREGIDLDLDEVIAAAKKHRVILEINAMPNRMDLNDRWVRAAVRAGVKLAISTDAHDPSHFELLHLGEAIARRGWAEKADIINTKTVASLLAFLKKR